MSREDGPSLYEILDVAESASAEEIERAYRIAAATYQPGSAAVYSVFSETESAELLRQVERAYRILSHPGTRREYDASRASPLPPLTGAGLAELAAAAPPEPGAHAAATAGHAAAAHAAEAPAAPRTPADLGEPPDGVYDGAILQRLRVSRGIELEEVSSVTKINANFIRYIEGNRYELLPAPVYVKGFVREIARALRLDPVRVCDTYMARYRQSTGKG
jgi:flagellar biosynthesis protein FlhG